MGKILIVDDESDIRDIISDILVDEGYSVVSAPNAKEALENVGSLDLDLVILDIWLEGSDFDGIGVLKRIKQLKPNLPVIMISGHGNIQTAVETIKYGAYDFIEKPFKAERLLILAKRAIELAKLSNENETLKVQQMVYANVDGISKIAVHLRENAKTLAEAESRVLITGETGVGKEIFARMIHSLSCRKNGPFITFYASSIDKEEFDEKLFGLDDGEKFKIGLLEKADSGVLFIDEFTEIPKLIQAKLLAFIQEKKFIKKGSNQEINPNIRIIAATTKDLNQEIKSGRLNESFFYRMNVAPINIMPLRERKEDIRTLIDILTNQLSKSLGLSKVKFLDEAIAYLEIYNWPGNIRQLRNMIEWLMIIKKQEDREIKLADLPGEIKGANNDNKAVANDIITKPLKVAREIFEKEYLKSQLERFGNNISKTADYIGMERTALHRKLKSLEIEDCGEKKAK